MGGIVKSKREKVKRKNAIGKEKEKCKIALPGAGTKQYGGDNYMV